MSTASALAIALPATGLIIAVVLAAWNGLTGRLDEHGRRLDTIESQMGQVLRALGRIEGRLGLAAESTEVA